MVALSSPSSLGVGCIRRNISSTQGDSLGKGIAPRQQAGALGKLACAPGSCGSFPPPRRGSFLGTEVLGLLGWAGAPD